MPTLRQKVGNWISGRKALGTDWFVNFMRLAAEEDGAGTTITETGAYRTVAWVNIAVAARARNISRALFKIYNGDTEVEQGPVVDLFAIGPYGTRYQLWEATEGWRCLRGEAIWILGWGGVQGFPQMIVVVDPATMKSKVDTKTQKIIAWEYDDSGMRIPFKPEEVIHFPMWNPEDSFRGMSEMRPLASEIGQESMAGKQNTKLLENSSIPGGVISIPGDELSADGAERMIERWEKHHKGVSRAGRVAVLGSGATYQRISMTPQEMQSFESRGWNRDTILAKFGVPHAVVGLKSEASTLSGKDTKEQMNAFWQITLLPELRYFQDKLQSDFFERYGLKETGEFDTSEIPELQEDQKELHDRLRLDVAAGVLTINEAREVMGNDPVDWGDVWWVPISLTPADVAQENAKNPPEPTETTGTTGTTEDDEEPIEEMFRGKKYTPAYKQAHWKSVVQAWEPLEKRYAKELKDFFYRLRKRVLGKALGVKDSVPADPAWLTDDWTEPTKELEVLTEKHFKLAVALTGDQLRNLFKDVGIDMGISWNIFDTGAWRIAKESCKKVTGIKLDTIRKQVAEKVSLGIEQGLTIEEMGNEIRNVFNIAQNRAETIARTELNSVINESRTAGFRDVGIDKQEWLSSQDELVRDSHRIDGEVRSIGTQFSNGLFYPGDPSGPPEEIINCRCLALPVFEE